MTRLTSKDKEILYDLTENLLQHLKSDGAVRITDKHIIIYKSVEDKNPQNIFIALLKEYAVKYGISYVEDNHKFSINTEDFKDFYICNKLASN